MNIKLWNIIGAAFTILLGSLLHFTYELSNQSPLVALFSAVNESTWEHLKLLAIPILIFMVIEYIAYGKAIINFIPIKFLSILLGMSLIVIIFYTYTGIFGTHYLWADIMTFILSVLASYWFSATLLDTDLFSSSTSQGLAIIGLIILILFFIAFTFYPPNLPLFQGYLTLS